MASTMSLFLLGISLLFGISSASPEMPKFNYSDPIKWGKESPECSNGKKQSPINIIPRRTVPNHSLGPLDSFYHIRNASLICNGLVVEVAADGKSELVIGGKTYKFLQMHWHTPSEHLINGIRFPAELHQVHKADDQSVAVIGVLYQYGKPDPIISTIKPYMEQMYKKQSGEAHEKENTIPIPKFPSMLIKDAIPTKYYRYSGSFTTPPCSEVVTWTIVAKARTISKEQVEELRKLVDRPNKHNARPAQPLNGRVVQRYE